MDTSVTVTGKRARLPADAAESLNGPIYAQDGRYRMDSPSPAFVADRAVAKGHAQ